MSQGATKVAVPNAAAVIRSSIRSKLRTFAITALSAWSVWFFIITFFKNYKLLRPLSMGQQSRALSKSPPPVDTSTNSVPLINSLWDAVAPVSFQMDEKGFLRLSDKIRTLVIDVGARDSDYLRTLEITKDPSVGLILVDPLPDSAVLLQQRAMTYSMLDMTQDFRHLLDGDKSKQVYMIKAAMGSEEGIQHFNIAAGPACGSLLEQSNASNFWCSKSKEKIQVAVLTLEGLLQRIPPFVESFHLKVDAEGADLMVLQGCKDSIRKFHTVIIECTDDTASDFNAIHVGGCSWSAARHYMDSYGFSTEWKAQGGLGNAFFLNRNITEPIPDFLVNKNSFLTFGSWYRDKAQQMAIATAA